MAVLSSSLSDIVSSLLAEIEAGRGLTLGAAGRLCGKNPSTVFRWIVKGTRRPDGTNAKLAAIKIGSKYHTSRRAVEQFISELTAPIDPVPAPRSASQRSRAAARAEAELIAAGA